MRSLPLNAIRMFESAARHLNFNRAAQDLHVTPSAVSHQIRALEDFLGVRLFQRQGRKVALTPEGESYWVSIRNAFEQLHAATEYLIAKRGPGALTVSAAPAFATPWLVPQLVEFQLAHPDIEIRLITSIELVDFSRSDVDVAIRYGLGKWAGLHSHRLFGEELTPVCSAALCKGPQGLKHPKDLRRATLLHALSRLGQWRSWLKLAGVTGVQAEQGPKFQSTPMALEAAIAGQGVAIADRRLVARYLEDGRLVTPFEISLPSESGYYLVYPPEREDYPRIAAFRAWLLNRLGQGRFDPA